MNESNRNQMNGACLAYLGDAVLEVMTRKHLLSLGITNVGKLNQMALDFVKAVNQSKAVERILPHLTEEEEAVYRRGRNANGISAPKSAATGEYRRATGFEALFAYLYLNGENDRIMELFNLAFPEDESEEK